MKHKIAFIFNLVFQFLFVRVGYFKYDPNDSTAKYYVCFPVFPLTGWKLNGVPFPKRFDVLFFRRFLPLLILFIVATVLHLILGNYGTVWTLFAIWYGMVFLQMIVLQIFRRNML